MRANGAVEVFAGQAPSGSRSVNALSVSLSSASEPLVYFSGALDSSDITGASPTLGAWSFDGTLVLAGNELRSQFPLSVSCDPAGVSWVGSADTLLQFDSNGAVTRSISLPQGGLFQAATDTIDNIYWLRMVQ